MSIVSRLRMGSPPHMRGKGVLLYSGLPCTGITPAHAGKSAANEFNVILPRDHPRTCGEKQCQKHTLSLYMGSPPHMRGKVTNLVSFNAAVRITPAHAGKSSLPSALPFCMRITPAHAGKSRPGSPGPCAKKDHPRTCGEKQQSSASRAAFPGITPAHAGKRARRIGRLFLFGDHPRTCGEKTQEVTKYKAYDILHA